MAPNAKFWARPEAELLAELGSSRDGLPAAGVAERLARFGPNVLREHLELTRLGALLNQLKNPMLVLLVLAAAMSAWTGEWVDAGIVVFIMLASVGIGFQREYQAHSAAAALGQRVKTRARVVRDGAVAAVPFEGVVPGDVVLLAAGSLVPADAIILESADLFVSEAALTGESFPAPKRAGPVPETAGLAHRLNVVFCGTNVRSGTARCLVVNTGQRTEFGHIAQKLSLKPPETEFDRGIRHFGYLLSVAMLVMVLLVFVAHMLQGRPPLETLLFAIALAVGLSPELLPAILSVNLARSADGMSKQGVLVRRLNAIENLGSMDVLCTDKTGTLTEGVVRLEGAWNVEGQPSPEVLELAAINAHFETGLPSPLDDAILEKHPPNLTGLTKLAEVPFDFVRKRISVAVQGPQGVRLLTKGAFHHVLEVCEGANEEALCQRYEAWGAQGIRVLAIAERLLPSGELHGRDDERGLTFRGFLTFNDQPKPTVPKALTDLARLGVTVKVITGDSKAVTQHVAAQVGLSPGRVLTGEQLDQMTDEALWHQAEHTDLFVEVDPNQKERVILSLKKKGHVVGFLGDGVNDAPAMHAADTSLSVDQAVDVAREAADFVLLERDLDVIRRGIEEGRKTFANTLKYILTTTSANLGNMVSMALASLYLPFLPLTAGQILLNNLLSDVPAVGLADDSVDAELVARPQRWSMRLIGRFMLEFGLLSSAMDMLTFAALLFVFHAQVATFRTGWFVESLLTELVVALVVRTRRSAFSSRPGRVLLWSTVAVFAIAVVLPYLPGVQLFGFVPLPLPLLGSLLLITGLYVAATELLKKSFYRRHA